MNSSAWTAQLSLHGWQTDPSTNRGGHPSLGVHRPGAFAERILYNGIRYSSFSCGLIIRLRMHIRLNSIVLSLRNAPCLTAPSWTRVRRSHCWCARILDARSVFCASLSMALDERFHIRFCALRPLITRMSRVRRNYSSRWRASLLKHNRPCA